jgi:hypothetical protein
MQTEDKINDVEEEISFAVEGSNLQEMLEFLNTLGFKVNDIRGEERYVFFEIDRNTLLLRERKSELKKNNFFIEGNHIVYVKKS